MPHSYCLYLHLVIRISEILDTLPMGIRDVAKVAGNVACNINGDLGTMWMERGQVSAYTHIGLL